MGASPVRCKPHIQITVRSPDSCYLSNFDQAAKIYLPLSDESLRQDETSR